MADELADMRERGAIEWTVPKINLCNGFVIPLIFLQNMQMFVPDNIFGDFRGRMFVKQRSWMERKKPI